MQITMERMKVVERNLDKIGKDFSGIEEIQRQAREFIYQTAENIDVDAGLYENGFLTQDEQNFCRQFHLSPPAARRSLLNGLKNANLHKQALRALWRDEENFDMKNEDGAIKIYLDKIFQGDSETGIFDYRGEQKRGLFAVNQEIFQIESTAQLDPDQKKVLDSYKQWILEKVLNHKSEV